MRLRPPGPTAAALLALALLGAVPAAMAQCSPLPSCVGQGAAGLQQRFVFEAGPVAGEANVTIEGNTTAGAAGNVSVAVRARTAGSTGTVAVVLEVAPSIAGVLWEGDTRRSFDHDLAGPERTERFAFRIAANAQEGRVWVPLGVEAGGENATLALPLDVQGGGTPREPPGPGLGLDHAAALAAGAAVGAGAVVAYTGWPPPRRPGP